MTTNTLLNHDAAPDGRFVAVLQDAGNNDGAPTNSVIVVQNWFQELRERVPVP